MGQNVEFRGNAREWFGIWIVNVVLTIITIGIYSAWAKVRTKKYFYGNTYVGGRNFDYHASGKQILIGRLIVIAAFILYGALSVIPLMAVLLPLAFIVVLPFLFYRSIRFNARVSSWSGVRFNFEGTYGGAFVAYLLAPFLSIFTLYLAWPFVERAQKRYLVNGHRLGRSKLSFDSGIGMFYAAFAVAVLCFLCFAVFSVPLFMAEFARINAQLQGTPEVPGLNSIFAFVLPFVGVFIAILIFQAMVRNIVYSNMVLDDRHRFASDVSPVTVAWIALSNAALVIGTFGLLLPWAQIRFAKYFAAHTEFQPEGSLDDFIAHREAEKSAIGDAYTDIEGVDFGINL